MKTILGFLCVLLLLFIAGDVCGSQSARTFLNGVNAYNQGDYDQAIAQFRRITNNGIVNDKLYYDIGNAYFKQQDLGRAILWYERAHQLAPKDPDLKFNLDFARSQTEDKVDAEEGGLYRILFFWHYVLSPSLIQKIAILLNGLFWLILSINAFLRKSTSRLFCWSASVLIAIFTLTAGYHFYETNLVKHAIVLAEEAPVRSGWTDESTELFVLHAGTKVKVEKAEKGYYRIYFSKGKIGWLKKVHAEVI